MPDTRHLGGIDVIFPALLTCLPCFDPLIRHSLVTVKRSEVLSSFLKLFEDKEN